MTKLTKVHSTPTGTRRVCPLLELWFQSRAVAYSSHDVNSNTLAVAGPVWGSAGHRMLETACQLPFGTAELIAKYPGLNLKGEFTLDLLLKETTVDAMRASHSWSSGFVQRRVSCYSSSFFAMSVDR